ncbi:CLUMA_CG011110, isoform A [Clunio marinus]|uniref:CLUMA_CG011110, isoform A n=1 Tax=Clunio marinus TaxID=568069 RepID=A0A1J1IDA2_9DIPT|nr:CLUMA_CG011110, isoform A [Clunio marinus]
MRQIKKHPIKFILKVSEKEKSRNTIKKLCEVK